MVKNNLLAKIASIISDKIDGDTLLLIEQHLSTALKTVCKWVAENKPVGHNRLIFNQNIDWGDLDTKYGFAHIDLTDTNLFQNPIVIQDTLVEVGLEKDTETYRLEPAHSIASLRLSTRHGRDYYYIRSNDFFISSDDGHNTLITIKHYIYADIDNFPDALEDYLVQEMLKLLQQEQNKQLNDESRENR